MNTLPEIGDYLWAEDGRLIARHLKVIDIKPSEHISDSLVTVESQIKKGCRYTVPLYYFKDVETGNN